MLYSYLVIHKFRTLPTQPSLGSLHTLILAPVRTPIVPDLAFGLLMLNLLQSGLKEMH